MWNKIHLTAEQRLDKAVADVMYRPEFAPLSGILLMGKREVVDSPLGEMTACTDGVNEQYGRGFVDYLTDPELRFVLLHETFHKMFRHTVVWLHLFEEDASCAGQATDYVINLMLVEYEPFIQMPKIRQPLIDALPKELREWAAQEGKPFVVGDNFGLLDSKYAGMDTAQVYALLRKEKQQQQQQSGGAGNPVVLPFDEHDHESAKAMTPEEVQQLTQMIDSALRQGALCGQLAGGLERAVGELLDVQIPWQEQVQQFLTANTCGRDLQTWGRPNRRYIASGMRMPGMYSENMPDVVIGVDTSGSIGEAELQRAVSEVVGLCQTAKPDKAWMLYWDTAVAGVEEYGGDAKHPIEDLQYHTQPKGGGGTDPTCVPQYLQEHHITPACVVMFTDGYVPSWGDWSVPVLWCVINNPGVTAPCGVTVHVEA